MILRNKKNVYEGIFAINASMIPLTVSSVKSTLSHYRQKIAKDTQKTPNNHNTQDIET